MKIPVLLPKIFDYPLTYNIDIKKNIKLGDMVEVPFGKDKEIGVVWKSIQFTSKKIKIKNIEKKINKYKYFFLIPK